MQCVQSRALSHTQGHPKRGSLTPPTDTGKRHFSGNVARIAKENIYVHEVLEDIQC